MNFGELYDDQKKLFFSILYSPTLYIFIFLFTLFVILSIRLYYKYYIEPKENNYKSNTEYIKSKKQQVELYFFYTTWCPHSKKAKDVLEKFQKENKSFKGREIIYFYIDAEEQEDLAEKFNVENYPTIYLVDNDDKIYFDANVKESLLKNFLESSL
jgi:thiol-disulfide isomerase/thioredoxin